MTRNTATVYVVSGYLTHFVAESSKYTIRLALSYITLGVLCLVARLSSILVSARFKNVGILQFSGYEIGTEGCNQTQADCYTANGLLRISRSRWSMAYR